MEFIFTKFEGAWLIKPKVFQDNRGFFLESYSKKLFDARGVQADFVQDNHSMSIQKNVLRGIHFQKPPHAQAKLVRVVKGSVYDVIVDLRKNSSTYSQWECFTLSAKNFQMLFVPRGFGHGFCTLEDNTEFLYKVDKFYAPEADAGIIWNDPTLKIDWPIENPILSEKDAKLPKFSELTTSF
jgi:dTDP-4-dehydrorhamnose 3,5-epimerase